jgi:hypothetical protein
VLRAYDAPLVPAPGSATTGSQYGLTTTYTYLSSPVQASRSYSRFFNTCYEDSNGNPVVAATPSCDSTSSHPAFQADPSFTLASIGPYLNLRELVHPLFDVSVFKQFKIHESASFEIRGEFFNVLNTPNFGAPGTTPGTAAYGVVTQTQVNDPRLVQLTARINF